MLLVAGGMLQLRDCRLEHRDHMEGLPATIRVAETAETAGWVREAGFGTGIAVQNVGMQMAAVPCGLELLKQSSMLLQAQAQAQAQAGTACFYWYYNNSPSMSVAVLILACNSLQYILFARVVCEASNSH